MSRLHSGRAGRILAGIGAWLAGSANADAADAKPAVRAGPVWEIRLIPVRPAFRSGAEVHFLLIIRNAGSVAGELAVPYLEDHAWPAWVKILREGTLLDPAVPEELRPSPTKIGPGETLTLSAGLAQFVVEPGPDDQLPPPYLHYAFWAGATIGAAKDAHAVFEVVGESGTALSWVAAYVDVPKTAGPAAAKQLLWNKIRAAPDDPKWAAAFRLLPREVLDIPGLLDAAKTTKDIGIRREAVRALGRFGRDAAGEKGLQELLRTFRTGDPTAEIGAAGLVKLKG